MIRALLALVVLAACEPEVGAPCDDDARAVDETLEPAREGGGNALVQDVRMDRCSQGLCASTCGANGDTSRGFCTERCESDAECRSAGDGFACARVVFFGPLASRDFDDERDCLTETDADGNPTFSRTPLLYCAAPPSVIEARDAAWGRAAR